MIVKLAKGKKETCNDQVSILQENNPKSVFIFSYGDFKCIRKNKMTIYGEINLLVSTNQAESLHFWSSVFILLRTVKYVGESLNILSASQKNYLR